jgi:bifunctional lysine-specific demethylase and histidyl-hydroxylase NO66
MAIRLPFFRVVKDGKQIAVDAYTRTVNHRSHEASGVIDPTAVLEHYRQGATIVLESLHRFWPDLGRFCRRLELDLGHPVQVNAYLTPPGAQGFARHSDSHDVFVLQIDGTKRWMVYSPDAPADGEKPVIETDLGAGDCFYIPVGWPHAASTNYAASAHLTVGVLTRGRDALFDEIVSLVRHGQSSERLPVRLADKDDLLRTVTHEELDDLRLRLDKLDHDELHHRVLRRLTTTSHENLAGGLLQIPNLDSINDQSAVRVKDLVGFRIWRNGNDVIVLLGDRELRMPGFVEPALRAIKDTGKLKVGELEQYLDEPSRLVLVQRLVREGLLEVVP